ncbi:MAG: hypothetical protein J6Q76_04400 [Clostridia bacterium]|nr:hypothetical protein [Clostridia bacterium]
MEKTVSKKSVTWLIFKISAICFAAVLALHIVIIMLLKNNIYLYFGGVASEEILNVVTAVLSLLFGLTVALLLLSFKKIRVLAIVITVLLGKLCVFMALLSLFFHMDCTYYELTSPDGQHEIIVKEKTLLFGCSGEFYEKTSLITMQKTGEYSTDDWPAMSAKTYEVEWLEDGFRFEYYYGNGIYKTEVVKYAD